jgi:hypothetical protein
VAPTRPDPDAPAAAGPARGHDRWVINKLRALNSWYTKGLDNGSHLRVAVNSAESLARLREISRRVLRRAVPGLKTFRRPQILLVS